mmetsp:Transcript_18151/g.21731  ORF Transcript_18151/g.21731 Transcript_18151/m.21731 type:complete len:171 (-) Transcript_18151:3-515(-)
MEAAAAAAVIVEALLARTMIVIVVTIRKIFVGDKLYNMTERCGGVVCLAADDVEANKRIEATPSDMVFSLRLSLTRLRSFDVMRNLDQPLATGIFGANKKEPDRCIKHPYQPRILLYFQTINLLLSTSPHRRVLQVSYSQAEPRSNKKDLRSYLHVCPLAAAKRRAHTDR